MKKYVKNIVTIKNGYRKDFIEECENYQGIFELIDHKGHDYKVASKVNPAGFWISSKDDWISYDPIVDLPEDLFTL